MDEYPAAELPAAFSALQHLESLDLQMVEFGGTLPPALCTLRGVTRLGVSLSDLQDQQARGGTGTHPRRRAGGRARCCMLASCLRARPRTHGCVAPSAHLPTALQALATAAFLPHLKELVLWQCQQPDVEPLPLPAALAGATALETLDCGCVTTACLPAHTHARPHALVAALRGYTCTLSYLPDRLRPMHAACRPCMGGLELRVSDGALLRVLPALRRLLLPAPEAGPPSANEQGADLARQRRQRHVLDALVAELAGSGLHVEESPEGHPFDAPRRLNFTGGLGWVEPPPGRWLKS